MMVTSLAPKIGYEQAAALAKEAFKSGKTIRELCREKKILAGRRAGRRARPLENDRTKRRLKQQIANETSRASRVVPDPEQAPLTNTNTSLTEADARWQGSCQVSHGKDAFVWRSSS